MHLGRRLGEGDLGAQRRDRLLDRHRDRAGHSGLEPREGAEAAVGHADVGRLEAHVAIEVRAIAVAPLAHLVGQRAQGEEVWGLEQRDRVGFVETHTGADLLPECGQSSDERACEGAHHESPSDETSRSRPGARNFFFTVL